MVRICFLGNSHTFYNGLAYQVLALAGPGRVAVEAHAAGGMGLDWHRAQPASVDAVRLQEWDAVVLQHRSHPFPPETDLAEACAWWTPLVRAAGAVPWLAMSWPEKARPQDAAMREAVYRRVAAANAMPLLPTARAWMAVVAGHPALELYDADAEHASPLGTYLAACVVLAAIAGIDPRGLPPRVAVRGHVLADLAPAAAAVAQAAAWDAVQAPPV